MASTESTVTGATTRYKLYIPIQWEIWWNIAKDKAQGHNIWEYVDPDAVGGAPTAPTEPARPSPAEGAQEVDRLTVEQYAYDLRKYERQNKAFFAFRTWIKESIDPTCFTHVEDAKTVREMLKNLKTDYKKSDPEIHVELDREFTRLRKSPRRQDINIWLEQWNHLYRRAVKLNYTKCTDYSAVLDFLKAVKSVHPEFAVITRNTIAKQHLAGETISTIPALTRELIHELHLEGGIPSSSTSTGFATFQGADTENPPAPAQQTPQSPKPNNKQPNSTGKQSNSTDKQKKHHTCLCGQEHLYSECPYLIPSKRPDGWSPDPQIALQVSDAVNRSERKQALIKRLVEESNKGKGNKKGKEVSTTQTATPTQNEEQAGGVKTQFCTVSGPITSEDELKNTVLLDSGASNHIFNNKMRFITYLPCNHESIFAGTTLAEVEGIGTARIMVQSSAGPREVTLSNALYIPTYQSNLVSMSKLQKKGAFFRPEAGEIIVEGKHLCYVPLRGDHYVLEAASNVDTALATATTSKHPRPSHDPKKSKATAQLWQKRLGFAGKRAIDHLQQASRNIVVEGKIEEKSEVEHLATAQEVVSRRTPEPAARPFEKVHFDLIVMSVAYNSDRYACHFVDDFSGYHKVYTFPTKGAINSAILYFIGWVYNQFGVSIQVFQTDGETSISKATKHALALRGIELHISAPYTPAQNGKAEVAGKIIIVLSRKLFLDSGLPSNLWPEYFMASAYFLNLMPTERLGWITPTEALQRYFKGWNEGVQHPHTLQQQLIRAEAERKEQDSGKPVRSVPDNDMKPSHAHLKAYACRAYPIIHKIPKTQKVESRAHIGYLVGYDSTNIYRCWIPSKGTVARYRDVTFDETKFYHKDEPEGPVPPELKAIELPEFTPYTNEDAFDIHLPESTWPELDYTPPQQEVADGTELPEPSQEEIDNEIPKDPYTGILTPGTTPDPSPEGRTQSSSSPGAHTPTSRDSTDPNSHGPGTSETFAPERLPTVANPVASATASTAQRRRKPIDTAIRSQEISADSENPDNILAGRTRGEQRRLQHGLLVAQVDQDSGIHTAFNAGMRHKLHQSTLPAAPEHYKDLEKHPYRLEFKNAAHQEFQALFRKGTFRKVELDKNRKLLPVRWVFTYKFDTDGYLTRFKARLCARGDLQTSLHEDTYAATLAARIFRALMALTAAFDLETCQFDATNAFTNANLDEEVYIPFPEGFRQPGYCLLLLKALYGLRQSPRLWYETFANTLRSMGLKQTGDEPCLFVNDWLIIFFFVDDVVALYHRQNRNRWETFKQRLFQSYEFKDLGEIKWFIGIRVIRDRNERKLWLCQDSYIDRIANRFATPGNSRYRSPLPLDDFTQYTRGPDDPASKETIFTYQQHVGSSLYPSCLTRPDAARSTAHLAEFSSNPDEAHMNAISRVIAYLQNTKTLAIQYSAPTPGQPVFEAYSDSAFADDSITRRSSSGYLIKLFGGPIDWKAYKQRSVTTSTTEAELHALTEAVREVYYWKRIFRDIGLCLRHEITAGCDNQQTIRLLTSDAPRLVTKLRHVDIKHHWLRQEIQAGRIKIDWVPTNEMPADGLTKALSIQQHEKFVKQLGLVALEGVDVHPEQIE